MQARPPDATSFLGASRRPDIMLPRHALCKTRSQFVISSQRLIPLSRSYNTITARSFSSLTRPRAKPRATSIEEAIWNPELQRRGAKRKASLNLDEVPQGAIGTDALPPQDDVEPAYPPLLQQVRNTMLKFDHCVVVTRVGGFYEVCIDNRDESNPLIMLSSTSNTPMSLHLY